MELVDRMHINPVAFAVAAIEHADAKQATRTDLTELVNFAFATSGISCAEKMRKFNSEHFALVSDVPAAAEYYNKLATDAAAHCHYLNNACTLLKRLGMREPSISLHPPSNKVSRLLGNSAQGSLLAPTHRNLEKALKISARVKNHFAYVCEHYNGRQQDHLRSRRSVRDREWRPVFEAVQHCAGRFCA